MTPETKEQIKNFAESYISAKDYRKFDDFETVRDLLREVENTIPLPFSIQVVEGEDAFMEAYYWSPTLLKSISLDCDWFTHFANADEFADELERTYQEYERVEKLLENIKFVPKIKQRTMDTICEALSEKYQDLKYDSFTDESERLNAMSIVEEAQREIKNLETY